MTTITFKLNPQEAARLRLAAQRDRISVSEFVRRQIREGFIPTAKVRKVTCPHTGAKIFSPVDDVPPLTTRNVKSMLNDFP